MRSLRCLAAGLVLPGLLLAAPVLVYALLGWGVAAPLAVTLALVGVLLLLLVLERGAPYHAAWNQARGDVRADVSSTLTLIASEQATKVVTEGVFVGVLLWSGAGLSTGAGWPMFLLALCLGDLGKYWVHRRSHETAGLWSIHSIHHLPERLYVLNGLRMHPLNVAWNAFFDVAPALLLGLSVDGVILLGTTRGVIGILQHANVSVRPGVFGWVFNNPVAHRWHHARSLSEGSCNYGSTLLLWDHLFGTYRKSEPTAHPTFLGLESGATMPSSWSGQLLWPLCRERLLVSCFTERFRAFLR